MNIVIFIDSVIGNSKGIQNTKSLYKKLKDKHNITIITKKREEEEGGLQTVNIKGPRVTFKHFNKDIVPILEKADILHLNSDSTGMAKWLLHLSNHYNVPTSYTFHGDKTHTDHWREQFKEVLLLAAQMDELIIPYENLRTIIQSHGFNKGVRIIRNGLNLEGWDRKSSTEWIEMRQKKGVSETFNVLYAGKVSTNHNSDFLFQAFLKFSSNNPSARLIILADTHEREKYVDFIEINNLKGKVIWYDKLPDSELPDFFSLGDVFVSTTDREQHNKWSVWAMANSMPVILKKGMFSKNVIKTGEMVNGNEFKDGETLYNALVDMFSIEPQLYLKMQKNAQTISREYDEGAMSDKYIAIWEDVKKRA